MKTLSASFKGILFIFIVAVSLSGHVRGNDNPTTPPMVQGIVASATNLAFNAEPTKRTNATTVTVHLIGAEGSYDAVHLAEDDTFSSNTQSYWRPPLGNYDGGTTITFILSSGDTLKTIWAVLDSGGESFSTPPTSATLILDTTQPDVASSTLQTQPDLRFQVTMEFSEPVHEFTAGDIWLGGVAISVENFTGDGMEYSFDVVASGEGQLTIGFYTDDVFDLAGNPVIEQASPLVEYYPFTPMETPGATESAMLGSGLFGLFAPSPLSLEESGGGQGMMLMGSLDPVWVDFNVSGPGTGVETDPFATLSTGLTEVADSGTIYIKPGESPETPRIEQPVRLEAPYGTTRIGDPTAGQTLYVQFADALPQNTPSNGVVAQVVRGGTAQPKALVIASVAKTENGVPSTVSNSWFELFETYAGNYSLRWKAPAGIDLSAIEEFEVRIDREESGSYVQDRILSIPVTEPGANRRWIPVYLGATHDVWRMKAGNYTITAGPGTSNSDAQAGGFEQYVFDVGQNYPINIVRTTITHIPRPDPYLGYSAGLPINGTGYQGWKVNGPTWTHEPEDILGPNRTAGGNARMYVTDMKIESERVPPIHLVEESEFAPPETVEILQEKIALSLAGSGDFGTAAELVLSQAQPGQSLLGYLDVYDASDPDNLDLLLSST